MKESDINNYIKKYIFSILGAFIFSIGVNLFIVPVGLYNGGFVGLGQLSQAFLTNYLNFDFGNFEVAGTIYFLINIPLFFLAYFSIGRSFFIKTLICVLAQTIFLTIIPIPKEPILSDILSACIVGGIIAGFGTGIILRAGGSGGGQDILGVYYTKKFRDFSVGKLTIIVNLFVYGICALMFDISIVIYSVLYTIILSFVVDRTHYQNIKMSVVIFTKSNEVSSIIINELERGATCWQGKGAYTNENMNIIYTAISKYEISGLVKRINEIDPNAFIVINECSKIAGNYIKKL